MRFQECLQYGSIILLTNLGIAILQNLEQPSDTGYTFRGYIPLLDLLKWDPEELKAVPTQQVYSLDDQQQYNLLRTNQVEQMCALITYMKHIFESYNSGIELSDDQFHPFSSDEWAQHTPTQMRIYLDHSLPNPHGPESVPSGIISSTRPTGYSTVTIELMGFKKGVKREIAAYRSL